MSLTRIDLVADLAADLAAYTDGPVVMDADGEDIDVRGWTRDDLFTLFEMFERVDIVLPSGPSDSNKIESLRARWDAFDRLFSSLVVLEKNNDNGSGPVYASLEWKPDSSWCTTCEPETNAP